MDAPCGGVPASPRVGSYRNPLLQVQRFPPALTRYPLCDAAGSAPWLVDGSGSITDTYVPDAFGRSLGGGGTGVNGNRYGGPGATSRLGARGCCSLGTMLPAGIRRQLCHLGP